MLRPCLALSCCVIGLAAASAPAQGFLPGQRSLFEAHNCYPYNGLWEDRIERMLAQPPPKALEFDLRWHVDPETGSGRLVVAHNPPRNGATPPTLREYAFERLRPLVEAALDAGPNPDWPLFTINLNDMRGGEPEMYEALWELTGEFKDWLSTAIKHADSETPAPIDAGPVLLLCNGGALEREHFYERVPEGGRLRLFGRGAPDHDATNFLRWINYPWAAVEPGGPPRAGEWTPEDAARLRELVAKAHERGYWIRFYALNGHPVTAIVQHGWSPGYNFGALDAARVRWRAAFEAGADFVATDQYEDIAALWQELRSESGGAAPGASP